MKGEQLFKFADAGKRHLPLKVVGFVLPSERFTNV